MIAALSNLSQSLQTCFGYGEFRPLQEDAVEAAREGRDVLVVMPTGAGKSMCFQLRIMLSERDFARFFEMIENPFRHRLSQFRRWQNTSGSRSPIQNQTCECCTDLAPYWWS